MSAARFLIRLREFTGQVDDWQGLVATDSQSILDTLRQCNELGDNQEHEPRKYQGQWKTLDVMSADWDVLIEIQESLKSRPGLVRQHVRGHQDLHTPYRKLSLLAQLNVDADHQASRYQRLYGAERPIAFLMPPMTCDPKTSRLDKLGKPIAMERPAGRV